MKERIETTIIRMKEKITNKKTIILKTLVMFFVIAIFIGSIEYVSAAAQTPTLVSKMVNAFKKIKEYLVKLAGPIAAVAIVAGIIIRKLSFGDEEKMTVGKRVIVNAIAGYFVILLVDLIIKFIEALV